MITNAVDFIYIQEPNNEKLAIVMELCDEGNLKKLFIDNKQSPPNEHTIINVLT